MKTRPLRHLKQPLAVATIGSVKWPASGATQSMAFTVKSMLMSSKERTPPIGYICGVMHADAAKIKPHEKKVWIPLPWQV